MNLLYQHTEEIRNACETYKVNNLYTFGSILTDRFNSESDIDFLVSISSEDPLEYAENYFELKFELERILKRKIDLLEQKSLNNKILASFIDRDKKLIYERKNIGVA